MRRLKKLWIDGLRATQCGYEVVVYLRDTGYGIVCESYLYALYGTYVRSSHYLSDLIEQHNDNRVT